MSLCTEMLVAFHSPKDRTLKADRAMLEPSGKLKVDCPEISNISTWASTMLYANSHSGR
jgi:hypothetical protein